MSNFLPYGRQTIDDEDIAAVSAALRADYLTTGPTVECYETAFAAATGAELAVACSSGTAALHLAVMAVGLGPGQAVVVPTMTFVATANVVRMTGAEVVFADVDAETGLMTSETLSAAVAQGRKGDLDIVGAIPVHLNGQVCDMSGLADVAGREQLWLVEDACHALGVVDVGATKFSRAACFSTHPVKAIATGEGGMVTTGDATLAARMRMLRSHGISRMPATFQNRGIAFDGDTLNPWYYEMQELGWNYRLPDVLCALGLRQLHKLARFHRRRLEIALLYDRLLAPLAPAVRPVKHGAGLHGWHLYALLIDFAGLGLSRARLMRLLRAQGIGAQVHYIPVHRQPYYRNRGTALMLPGADSYHARCLSIPMFPGLTDADVERVVGALAGVVGGRSVA